MVSIIALGLGLLTAVPVSAQPSIADVAEGVSPAVFQIIGEFGQGSGFLWDGDAGLVLTNAHITSGAADISVKYTPEYKTVGAVVYEDRRTDVAVVRVNPAAVAGLPTLRTDESAYRELRVGDPLIVMGFPGTLGAVTTTGILARKGEGFLLTDAGVSPGNSGGPVLTLSGALVGMTTFGTSVEVGTGLGGAVSAPALDRTLSAATVPDGPPPSADSLPVMPTDFFPMDVLEAALAAEGWPNDVYDISSAGVGGGGYNVHVITPPFLVRNSASLQDLSLWRQELGQFPPVVVLRVYPKVGQSGLAVLANFALAAASAATDTRQSLVSDIVAKGSMAGFRLQGPDGSPVTPVQTRRSVAIRSGVQVQVVHIVLPPQLFVPDEPDDYSRIVFEITEPDGSLRIWAVPEATARQVYEDFRMYLSR